MSNSLMFQAFEWYIKDDGNFWKELKAEIPYLKSLGVNRIWLPPAFKGHRGRSDVGYGVYDVYDLGEFNQKGSYRTKYGTKDEYLDLIKTIKENEMDLVVDIVLNHRLGADETESVIAKQVDFNNRYRVIETREIEAWTKYYFPGRNDKYSSFKWNKNHFKAVDYDMKYQQHGIFLFEGKEWSKNVDTELQNYDYLMGSDIDFENEEVQEELLNWLTWYHSLTGFNGVRLDAVKHIDSKFFKEGLKVLRSRDTQSFAVGEYWSSDLKALHNYLMDVDFSMQLFDVPLHHALENASKYDNFDLRDLNNKTLLSNNPDYAVTFVDNHDTQKGQSLESWVQEWFKPHAYAFILLRDKGIPSVFYGDLYGSELGNITAVKELPVLMKLRAFHSVGTFFDYMDDHDTVGWCRTGDDSAEGYAVVMNHAEARIKRMFVGKRNAGCEYVNCFDQSQTVRVNEDGIGEFPVHDRSLAVYIRKDGKYMDGILK